MPLFGEDGEQRREMGRGDGWVRWDTYHLKEPQGGLHIVGAMGITSEASLSPLPGDSQPTVIYDEMAITPETRCGSLNQAFADARAAGQVTRHFPPAPPIRGL